MSTKPIFYTTEQAADYLGPEKIHIRKVAGNRCRTRVCKTGWGRALPRASAGFHQSADTVQQVRLDKARS